MANLFDSTNAPEGEPTEIVVGDFIQWKRTDIAKDYDPSLYTATLIARLTTGGASEIQITATNQTSYYLFASSSAASSAYVAGKYYWQLEIVRNLDSERIVIDRGNIDVIADLDVNQTDIRSHSQVMVDKIESLLSGKADSDVASYSIAGRSLTKMSFKDLVDARNFYKSQVAIETAKLNAKKGIKGSSTIQARF